MPKQLTEREIKYWLTKNTPRSSCWIVYTEIERMTNHLDKTVTKISMNNNDEVQTFVPKQDLNYVYTAYMTTKQLITIFQLKNGLYFMLNNKKVAADQSEKDEKDEKEQKDEKVENKDEGNIEEKVNQGKEEKKVEMKTVSSVLIAPTLRLLLNNVSSSVRKLINLEKVSEMVLSKDDELRLKRVLGLDFANCKDEDELLNLFRKYLIEIKNLSKNNQKNEQGQTQGQNQGQGRDLSKVLDFSGNMNIYPLILEKLNENE